METKTNYSIAKLLPVLFSFFVMGFVDIVGISVGYVKDDFHLSNTMAKLLPMLVFMWFTLCSLPIGIMMKKVGRKNTVLLSAIVTTIGLLVPLVNYSFSSMLITFALLGIGNTILQVSLNPLVTNVTRPENMTSVLTLGQFVKSISSMLGPVIVPFLASKFGPWQTILPIYAAATVLSFVWLVLTPIHEEKEVSTQKESSIFSLFKDTYLLSLFSIILLIVGFEVGLLSSISDYFLEQFNISRKISGYANTLYFIAKTVGTFGGAILLGKLPIKKFFVGTMIVAVLAFCVFWLVSDLSLLYTFVFILGLATANVFPIVFSNALQYCPEKADEISAFMIMGVGGGAIIPFIMGVIADSSSQKISLLLPLFALVYILFGAMFILRKTEN